MNSLLALVHAWPRVVILPAVIWWLVARVAAPPLGWPRADMPRIVAAWLLSALVPVSGLARLGEVDVVVLAALAWYTRAPGAARGSWALAAWVVGTAGALWACGSLVVTRYAQCVEFTTVPAPGVVVLLGALGVLLWVWPRGTIAERMSLVAIAAIALEVVRQLATVWL
jgi:hypothetical protein